MAEIDYTALTHALLTRRFLPQVFDTAAEAKAAALQIIGDKSVGIGGSATVRDMGLAEALQANGNQVYCHWPVAKEAKQAARDKALTADVYLSSTNALITDGRLVNIDGTGNRAAGLIYGPHEVIVIAGKTRSSAPWTRPLSASSAAPAPPTPGGWAWGRPRGSSWRGRKAGWWPGRTIPPRRGFPGIRGASCRRPSARRTTASPPFS